MPSTTRSETGNKIYWGVKTGLNDAFVISAEQRATLIAADPRSAEIIKPLGIGTDVRKWRLTDQGKFLIFAKRGVPIEQYPAVLAHLEQFRDRLSARATIATHPWYELQQPQEGIFHHFDNPKIIYPDIAKESRFLLDLAGTYVSNTTYFIPGEDYYLLGILNSAVMWSYCKSQFTVIGDPEQGGRLRFFSQDVLKIPIPLPTEGQRAKMIELVQRCVNKGGVDCQDEEAEIDALARQLFGVSS